MTNSRDVPKRNQQKSRLLNGTRLPTRRDIERAARHLLIAASCLLVPSAVRASYVRDRTRRPLLTPGERERLDFSSIRLLSSRFELGSHLLVVMSVIKESGRQINYGSGEPVSDETVKDAGAPLEIK